MTITKHHRTPSPSRRMLGVGLWHFLENQFVRYRATWTSTIITSILFPIMFLVSIGFGLGTQIDDTSSLGTDDYASFVGPGILAAVALIQAGSLSLWPTLGAIKWEGTYQAALSTPLTAAELATGHILWIGFRVVVGASFYLAVLALFGIVASPLGLLAPLVAGLTGLSIAAPLSAYSATRESDNTFSLINRVGLTPMFLFSGAFFPVAQLPDSVEWVSKVIPVSHGVELSRNLVNGTISAGPAALNVGVLVLWAGLGWAMAIRTFEARLSA